ncbi:MAG: type 4a pilus biogenesis protein PilO [Zetaproteobacteria bacterium]|nr:type 4a pilus biogenesis protein PilO [Zetaproteobacteria bacterium]
MESLNLEFFRPMLPLPLWQKLLGLLFVVVILMGAYFALGWMPVQDEIEQARGQVEQQQMQLKRNQHLAQNLPKKRAEYEKLKVQLSIALELLPKKSQIPDLLESVTRAGTNSGLEFKVFKPRGESVKEIYAEVPVDIVVTGTFRQLLTFLKRVGEMQRIVAVKHLTIRKGQGDLLRVKGNVMTYRFVEHKTKK